MPKDRKRAPRVDVVTREFTINLHKRLHKVCVCHPRDAPRTHIVAAVWLLGAPCHSPPRRRAWLSVAGACVAVVRPAAGAVCPALRPRN